MPCHWRKKIGAEWKLTTGAVEEEWVSVERSAWFGRSGCACDQLPRKRRRVTILEVLRKVWLGMKACECCGRARVMYVYVLQQRNEE